MSFDFVASLLICRRVLVYRLRQLPLEREKWPFFVRSEHVLQTFSTGSLQVAPWMVMHQVKKDNSRHAHWALMLSSDMC